MNLALNQSNSGHDRDVAMTPGETVVVSSTNRADIGRKTLGSAKVREDLGMTLNVAGSLW